MAERLSPPIETLDGLPLPPKSSCLNDRSFFVRQPELPFDPERGIDYKQQLYLLTTPSDPETGVPLILHPDGASNPVRIHSDDDHHPEHPCLHRQLLDVGGLAIRHSRVQTANWWLHHMDAHTTFRGPALPVTEEEKFRRVVYNAAGYIPERAIRFRGPRDYYLEPLSEDIRAQLWKRNIIRVERPKAVRDYLKDYLFDQQIDAIVSRKLIKRFMSAKDPVDRWKRAKEILSLAAQEATDGMEDTYRSLAVRTLLPPDKGRRVSRFIVHMLANRESEKSRLSLELQATLRRRHA